jgi:hypothetical protein
MEAVVLSPEDVEALRPHVTSIKQHEILDAFKGGAGSISCASRVCNMAEANARRAIKRLKANAARKGVALEQGMRGESVPEGYVLEKSTVHVKDGSVYQRWDRVKQDEEDAHRGVLEAVEGLASGLPIQPPTPKPKGARNGLLNLYTISDLHIGLYAWGLESGANYSTKEAQRLLWSAYKEMLERMPDADEFVLCNLGDFMHYDGLVPMTPEHGNILDADSRYSHMAEIALSMNIWMIEEALKKHKRGKVIQAEGNHDPSGSVWLRIALKQIFKNNPRVEIDCEASPYYAHLHGETMLAFHHGHKKKDKDVGEVFSGDLKFRKMWGQATQTYVHTGNLHSQSVNELSGVIIERHASLSARSAYAARGGWVSKREAKAICYTDKGSEYMRISVTPEV